MKASDLRVIVLSVSEVSSILKFWPLGPGEIASCSVASRLELGVVVGLRRSLVFSPWIHQAREPSRPLLTTSVGTICTSSSLSSAKVPSASNGTVSVDSSSEGGLVGSKRS